MNKLLYKNKNLLLKIKRKLNSFTGFNIIKYPDNELYRRITLLKHHQIDVILDVGANIGQFGCEMRNLGFKGTIISFEPMLEAFQTLSKNASKDKNWFVYQSSLGERDGKTTINISKNSVSSSLLKNVPQLTNSAPNAAFFKTEKVDVKKLDSIFDSLAISDKNIYLKIDTQGYEEKVLEGAANSLKHIKGIQIEMGLIPSYEGTLSFDEMKSKLNDLGYRLVAIENGFYDKKTGKQLEIDGIFYKEK